MRWPRKCRYLSLSRSRDVRVISPPSPDRVRGRFAGTLPVPAPEETDAALFSPDRTQILWAVDPPHDQPAVPFPGDEPPSYVRPYVWRPT
jgi:hypothetical protein